MDRRGRRHATHACELRTLCSLLLFNRIFFLSKESCSVEDIQWREQMRDLFSIERCTLSDFEMKGEPETCIFVYISVNSSQLLISGKIGTPWPVFRYI